MTYRFDSRTQLFGWVRGLGLGFLATVPAMGMSVSYGHLEEVSPRSALATSVLLGGNTGTLELANGSSSTANQGPSFGLIQKASRAVLSAAPKPQVSEPGLASPQVALSEPDKVGLKASGMFQDLTAEAASLRIALLPRGSRSSGAELPTQDLLLQGGSAGQRVCLVLRSVGRGGEIWPVAVVHLNGEGEGRYRLTDPGIVPGVQLEAWTERFPSSTLPARWWPGPVISLTQTAGPLGASQGWGDTAVVPQAGGMVVSEIMKDPSAVSDSSGEWIELYNPLWMRQNIEGWTLSDDGGSATILSNGGLGIWVAGRGHRALTRNDDPASNGGVVESYRYTGFSLSNGEDEVILSRPDGTVVDRVAYDNGARWPDSAGATLQLSPGIESPLANDNPALWCAGSSAFGMGDLGTPGMTNDDC